MLNWLVKPALAQGVPINDKFGPAKNFFSIGSLINVLLPNILTIAGVIALVGVVIAGFNVIMHAGGEPDKTNKNQQAFTGALIGLILIFGAYWLIQIIETLTGFNILHPNIGG